jgi:osmotically-inducible protein OsmY
MAGSLQNIRVSCALQSETIERNRMKAFVGFLLGVLIAIAVVWFLNREPDREVRLNNEIEQTGDELKEDARELGDEVSDEVQGIDTDRIRENVEDVGEHIAEASADALITGKVKAEFASDPAVSALSIDVDTTDGLVTLSGKVSSDVEAERAVALAREVEGVNNVVSSLQVRRD